MSDGRSLRNHLTIRGWRRSCFPGLVQTSSPSAASIGPAKHADCLQLSDEELILTYRQVCPGQMRCGLFHLSGVDRMMGRPACVPVPAVSHALRRARRPSRLQGVHRPSSPCAGERGRSTQGFDMNFRSIFLPTVVVAKLAAFDHSASIHSVTDNVHAEEAASNARGDRPPSINDKIELARIRLAIRQRCQVRGVKDRKAGTVSVPSPSYSGPTPEMANCVATHKICPYCRSFLRIGVRNQRGVY